MEKQTKITYLLFWSAILSTILHNIISGFLGVEEPVFFILFFVLALGFVISVIYNTILYIIKGRPKDLWKLGWLGLFGLIGLLPNFGSGFYGFFGFFAFWGMKGKGE